MRAPDYGHAFTLWRAACPDAWAAYTEHAFVRGLGDGTLPRSAFLTYLRQDYVFLIHFARAWSLAVVKAGTLAEMKAASATVHALLSHEMELHVEVCAAAGVSRDELEATEEAQENIAYTRFVLEGAFRAISSISSPRWRPASWATARSAIVFWRRLGRALTANGSKPTAARITRRSVATRGR